MAEIVEILAMLVVGTMVGSEFAVAAFVNPVVGRLSDDPFRAARGDAARLLGRVMPFWYLASLVLLVMGAAVERNRLIASAAVLMAAVVVSTVAVLVPINKRIAAGDASRPLAARWDRLHWMRVAILLAVFTLLVVAVAVIG